MEQIKILDFIRELTRFFKEAIDPELEGASQGKQDVLGKVERALRQSKLAPASPDIEFLWQSRHGSGRKLWPNLVKEAEVAKRIDVHSPWADPSLISELCKSNDRSRVHIQCLKDPRYAYKNESRLTLHFDGIISGSTTFGVKQSHAKAYLFSNDGKQTLYFGSANMTASGVGVSKTPNTEVLVKWYSNAGEFRELLCRGSGSEVDDESATASKLTPQEKLQQELFATQVAIEYSEVTGRLTYKLKDHPSQKLTIRHLLLEPLHGQTTNDCEIQSTTKSSDEFHLPVHQRDLKKFSSWIVLSAVCQGEKVEADIFVDLPPAFYDARVDLRDLQAFRLIGDELIQELLMQPGGFSVGGGGVPGGGGGGPDSLELWVRWLERVHLERMMLRLYRMQKRDPVMYEQRSKRLQKVIEDLDRSEEPEFVKLAGILKEVKHVLAA